MTTLALLKAEIADDLNRTDLSSQIANEIGKAILHYRKERFYFNTTRDVTFATVADQKIYAAADSASIAKFIEIDEIVLSDGLELWPMAYGDWERLTQDGNSTGKPCNWTYYARSIGLYPIPDAAYTVRISGLISKDAPASDGETDNVWMTEAFDLIRFRAGARVAAVKTLQLDLAQGLSILEGQEFLRLKNETNSREGTGFVTPTEW